MAEALQLLLPGWQAPPGVGAAMTLRDGGASVGPWRSLNLGAAVGDDGAAVAANRARFGAAIDARPFWLRQVHGTRVLRLPADEGEVMMPADAAWTDAPGVACSVLVADCLPVLYALRDGRAVAAAHAGWRGLAAGVVEAALRALCAGTGAAPADVQVWLGPCIGPRRFEVGADVLQAFGQDAAAPDSACFVRRDRSDGAQRWYADLRALAAARLRAAGVSVLTASDACTAEDPSRFFSFRRDGVTGRMAAAIWRR